MADLIFVSSVPFDVYSTQFIVLVREVLEEGSFNILLVPSLPSLQLISAYEGILLIVTVPITFLPIGSLRAFLQSVPVGTAVTVQLGVVGGGAAVKSKLNSV